MESSSKIAKNTVYLYIRMLFVMLVTLFTSRVILKSLGATDYGLFNVVGGVVTLFSFLTGSMAGATSRYITYELGCGNRDRLCNVFSASLNLYILLALFIFILGEVFGIIYLNNGLNLPLGRLNACYYVLHFSIGSAIISCIQIPYTSAIIAHENMKIYAFVGIYEALSRLFIAYFVFISPFDKLIFYAMLFLINQAIIGFIYVFYSTKSYTECRFKLLWDKSLYKSLTSYSFYDLTGSLALVVQTQGLNMVLNFFFGPIVNAARAIAIQVNGAIIQMVNNFLMAVKPHVIKQYAQNKIDDMYIVTFKTMRFSFFLMICIVLPVFFEIDEILEIWLGEECPAETVAFTQIILLVGLVQVFIYNINMIMHAIGRLKEICVLNSLFYFLPLPISYFLYQQGAPSYTCFIIVLVCYVGVFINTFLWVRKFEFFKLKVFCNEVIIPIFRTLPLTVVVPIIIKNSMEQSFCRLIINTFSSIIVFVLIVIALGLQKSEKEMLYIKIKEKIHERKD